MRRSWSGLFELLLLAGGCGGAAAVASSLLPKIAAMHQAKYAVVHPASASKGGEAAPVVSGTLVGNLSIAALGLNSPVLEDCTPQNLKKASCHMTGTARLGGLGTAAVAGHRDASFHVLQSVKRGEPIAVRTAEGTYFYSIDETIIVSPEEVSILSRRDQPSLVLVTCYPFHYVGAAPKRFVVLAHLLSAAPVS